VWNPAIRRSVVGSRAIVALAVTVWTAAAQAGPVPTPTPPLATRSIVGCGYGSSGQATPPDSVNGVLGTATRIAARHIHSCAIQAGTDYIESTRIKCFE
jgi:hypothetical protein